MSEFNENLLSMAKQRSHRSVLPAVHIGKSYCFQLNGGIY